MTEYDYSPAAWEAHLAKQASIARWSQETAQQKHAYTNPFKPSPEEVAKKNASDFYGGGEVYEGPDRPPTPTNPGPTTGLYGYAPQAASGQQQAPAATAGTGAGGYQTFYYAGSVLVPRWTGTQWVYETHPNPNQASTAAASTTTGAKSSGSSIKSGKSSSSKKPKTRPTPVKSYTLPPSYVYQQQNPQYYQMPLPPQPNSGNTTASGGSGGAYATYTYPTVMVDGAMMRKDSTKLTKKKKASGDGASFFGRLGKS